MIVTKLVRFAPVKRPTDIMLSHITYNQSSGCDVQLYYIIKQMTTVISSKIC